MSTSVLTSACAALALSAATAGADVAFNNLGMNDTYGTGTYSVSGPGAGLQWVQAFKFNPTRSGAVVRLVVPVVAYNSATFMTFHIYTDNNGFPWSELGAIGDAAPAQFTPPPYPAPLQIDSNGAVVISAGTSYWLVATSPGSGAGGWFYNGVGQSGPHAYRIGTDLNWQLDSGQTAGFRIEVTPSCPADFDGNGHVEPADVSLFVNTWFNSLANGTLAGDFDHNGIVQPADVSLFISTWLAALSGGC